MATTIADIARASGVSHQLVSKVLNGGSGTVRVSEVTRRRVLDIAEQRGYRPNSAARAFRSGKFNAIALVSSSTETRRSYVPNELIYGTQTRLAQQNMHLIVTALSDETLTDDEQMPKLLREWMADGLLINYTHDLPHGMAERIDQLRVPAIWLNRKESFDSAYPDDRAGGYLATQLLIERGHTKIAFVLNFAQLPHAGSTEHHYSLFDRFDGYRAALAEIGRAPMVWDLPPGEHDIPTEQYLARLRSPDRPSAVFVYHYPHAIRLYSIAMSCGLRVPDDLAIFTVGGSQIIRQANLPIGTVWSADFNDGHRAVDMLIQKMKSPKTPLASVAMPFVSQVYGV
jgi:LacI family transcriptional regulator